ncbi:MAG: glycosyltransferase [Bdellovibrionota bacterium]
MQTSTFKVNKVGIAMAAYEPDPSFFGEQLRSIQEQTFSDWVCIVNCDSSLESFLKLPEMSRFVSDHRFKWRENKERLGHKKNFEAAIQAVLTEGVNAIACADQDDIWYKDKLAVSVDELEKHGPLSLVHCDMHVLANGKIAEKTAWEIEMRGIHNSSARHLMIRNIVAGCSMLFDAELARRYPRIPDGAMFHDHWYALVASLNGGVFPIKQALYAYRQHEANEVGVTPFVGRFVMPSKRRMSLRDVLEKCELGWLKSYNFANSARKEGLQFNFFERQVFLAPFDLGAGIMFLGLRSFFSDPPLARACIARSIGKAIHVLLG